MKVEYFINQLLNLWYEAIYKPDAIQEWHRVFKPYERFEDITKIVDGQVIIERIKRTGHKWVTEPTIKYVYMSYNTFIDKLYAIIDRLNNTDIKISTDELSTQISSDIFNKYKNAVSSYNCWNNVQEIVWFISKLLFIVAVYYIYENLLSNKSIDTWIENKIKFINSNKSLNEDQNKDVDKQPVVSSVQDKNTQIFIWVISKVLFISAIIAIYLTFEFLNAKINTFIESKKVSLNLKECCKVIAALVEGVNDKIFGETLNSATLPQRFLPQELTDISR